MVCKIILQYHNRDHRNNNYYFLFVCLNCIIYFYISFNEFNITTLGLDFSLLSRLKIQQEYRVDFVDDNSI